MRCTTTDTLQDLSSLAPAEGIRFEVILFPADGSRPLATFHYQHETDIEPGEDAPLRLDVESMYLGSDTRVLIRALPVKVGSRELSPPPGW